MILNAIHDFNIVATLFRIVATLFQHCYAVLRKKLFLRIVPCDTTLSLTDIHGITKFFTKIDKRLDFIHGGKSLKTFHQRYAI